MVSPWCFDTLFCKLAYVHDYNQKRINVTYLCQLLCNKSREENLSYYGAHICNHILNISIQNLQLVHSKKLIQNLFLLSNHDICSRFRTCYCIVAPLICMFSACVFMYKLKMSEYNFMGMCTHIHVYLKIHAGSLTGKDSALLHRFYVLHPKIL